MNKNGNGIGLLLSKSMCAALTMILAACLFVAGAFAEPGCGDRCRCHHGPMDSGHSKGKPIPSSADFCNGDPMIPCDLESNPASRFLKFIPDSVGVNQIPTAGPANMAADCQTDGLTLSGAAAFRPWPEKPRTAPLYLQKASFLI